MVKIFCAFNFSLFHTTGINILMPKLQYVCVVCVCVCMCVFVCMYVCMCVHVYSMTFIITNIPLQATKHGVHTIAGLIPSNLLEERYVIVKYVDLIL